jgi:hypothetical protein
MMSCTVRLSLKTEFKFNGICPLYKMYIKKTMYSQDVVARLLYEIRTKQDVMC